MKYYLIVSHEADPDRHWIYTGCDGMRTGWEELEDYSINKNAVKVNKTYALRMRQRLAVSDDGFNFSVLLA